MGNDAAHTLRQWLVSHKFPPGFVAVPGTGGLSATLDGFKQDGWTTMKSGIGRTRAFADTLLQHRLEVVVVPELPRANCREKPRGSRLERRAKEAMSKMACRSCFAYRAASRTPSHGQRPRAASRSWEGKHAAQSNGILLLLTLEQTWQFTRGRIVLCWAPVRA